MKEDFAHIRRTNLKAWVELHGTPQKERSYFSQLMLGDCSFGERAARRLERDYNMPPMYLDNRGAVPEPPTLTPPQAPAADERPPRPGTPAESEADQIVHGATVLARVDMEELELLSKFREKSRRGKDVVLAALKVAEKEPLTGLRRNHKG